MTQWEKYIEYLKKWAEEHSGKEYEGMSPAGYNEWQDNENEQTGDDIIIAQITWTVADVRTAFRNEYGREPTDGQLQDCIENVDTNTLEERSIEFGWTFIDEAII